MATSSKDKKRIFFVPIKVSQEKSYADVLGNLRTEVNPDAIGSRIVRARATQNGDVLILLDKESNKQSFTAEVKRLVGDLGDVRADSKKVALAIQDVDHLATEKDVKTAE